MLHVQLQVLHVQQQVLHVNFKCSLTLTKNLTKFELGVFWVVWIVVEIRYMFIVLVTGRDNICSSDLFIYFQTVRWVFLTILVGRRHQWWPTRLCILVKMLLCCSGRLDLHDYLLFDEYLFMCLCQHIVTVWVEVVLLCVEGQEIRSILDMRWGPVGVHQTYAKGSGEF